MDLGQFDELTRTAAAEGKRQIDDRPFDRFTRRLVLGGASGGVLALLGRDATAGKRGSKVKKRCQKQHRAFCAGRCCAAGQGCAGGACVETCADPFSCAHQSGGLSCADEEACFCGQTRDGVGVCVARLKVLDCEDLTPCTDDGVCLKGQVCATCVCNQGDDFRCQDPCFGP